MTELLSVGISAWNLHAHRYYRVRRRRGMRSWSVGPIRVVATSYRISEDPDAVSAPDRRRLLLGEPGDVEADDDHADHDDG